MTIECYDTDCPFHSCHHQPDDGPFCDEEDCQFSNCDATDKAKELLNLKEVMPK